MALADMLNTNVNDAVGQNFTGSALTNGPCAIKGLPCRKALSGIGAMHRFGGAEGGASPCFNDLRTRSQNIGIGGLWLYCLLLVFLQLALPVTAQTVLYVHTDALGSVVAKTDADGNVVERYDYQPYGQLIGRPATDGPAYTGHVSDGSTGLSYMQQRYMDPQLGVFLSVDPVTAYQKPIEQFNRYRYANGNPFRFTDPDGRQGLPRSVYETDWTKPETRLAFTETVSLVADFTPVVGDAKGVVEAARDPTGRNILAATVGFVPLIGDVASKGIKSADHLVNAAGKLERVKGGARQGRVEGVRERFLTPSPMAASGALVAG